MVTWFSAALLSGSNSRTCSTKKKVCEFANERLKQNLPYWNLPEQQSGRLQTTNSNHGDSAPSHCSVRFPKLFHTEMGLLKCLFFLLITAQALKSLPLSLLPANYSIWGDTKRCWGKRLLSTFGTLRLLQWYWIVWRVTFLFLRYILLTAIGQIRIAFFIQLNCQLVFFLLEEARGLVFNQFRLRQALFRG